MVRCGILCLLGLRWDWYPLLPGQQIFLLWRWMGAHWRGGCLGPRRWRMRPSPSWTPAPHCGPLTHSPAYLTQKQQQKRMKGREGRTSPTRQMRTRPNLPPGLAQFEWRPPRHSRTGRGFGAGCLCSATAAGASAKRLASGPPPPPARKSCLSGKPPALPGPVHATQHIMLGAQQSPHGLDRYLSAMRLCTFSETLLVQQAGGFLPATQHPQAVQCKRS